jgi:Rod binding domain-containing protein
MKAALTQHDKLTQTARVWVAQTFYGQMLKQMRESPFKSSLFDGGRGGEAFQAQLDQRMAERMASSHSGDRLVQSIVRRIEGKKHVATTH